MQVLLPGEILFLGDHLHLVHLLQGGHLRVEVRLHDGDALAAGADLAAGLIEEVGVVAGQRIGGVGDLLLDGGLLLGKHLLDEGVGLLRVLLLLLEELLVGLREDGGHLLVLGDTQVRQLGLHLGGVLLVALRQGDLRPDVHLLEREGLRVVLALGDLLRGERLLQREELLLVQILQGLHLLLPGSSGAALALASGELTVQAGVFLVHRGRIRGCFGALAAGHGIGVVARDGVVAEVILAEGAGEVDNLLAGAGDLGADVLQSAIDIPVCLG